MVVIGLGNIDRADDGAGSRVIREIADKVPPGVEVIDAGMPGPGLIHLLEGREKAIIVDAVDGGGPPGTVWHFRPNEAIPNDIRRTHSLHQGDVLEQIELAETLGIGPREVVLIGIQPGSFSLGDELSPPVTAAIGRAATLAISEATLTP